MGDGIQAPMTALCILTMLIGKDAINLRERHWRMRPVARCGHINPVVDAREEPQPYQRLPDRTRYLPCHSSLRAGTWRMEGAARSLSGIAGMV